ncbi:ABC transporter permease [Herminiimonas sp. CN]|uniref:ABC transporter permease n=1 Tax=Herminiimonas sp. CN TaxID=1349818 RepID=UPI00047383C3|nr:ABC transporter permease [Herminiimonas sp. CN]
MQQFSLSPQAMLRSFTTHRRLILALTRREVVGRYRGSMLGILWSFFNPIVMLSIYTFVFSVVFKARWSGGSESRTEFAVVLFAGMIVFNLFAECINRAPSLIVGNVNYVKKVVFPLEILPWVALGSTLFHGAVSLLVWLAFYVATHGFLQWTIVWLPLMLLPLVLLTMGLSWFLAAFGVYVRDVAQTVGMLTTILMFLSPVFFPVSALPLAYRPLIYANPLTFIIEQVRNVLIWGKAPDWPLFGLFMLLSGLVCWAGFAWFQKTRKGFSDVL